MNTNWGLRLKQILEEKGISQSELAHKTGLSDSYISRACKGHFKNPNKRNFDKIARALSMSPDELSREVYGEGSHLLAELPEQVLERLRLIMPVSIPVYEQYQSYIGEYLEPEYYISMKREGAIGKKLKGYTVRNDCLYPEIQEGDTIIIDQNKEIKEDDIVACLYNGMLHLGKLKIIANEKYLENNQERIKLDEVKFPVPVIEMTRKFK